MFKSHHSTGISRKVPKFPKELYITRNLDFQTIEETKGYELDRFPENY